MPRCSVHRVAPSAGVVARTTAHLSRSLTALEIDSCALQMREHGDPTRRGGDAGEALGASIKDGIHNRTVRRKMGTTPTVHKLRDDQGQVIRTWTQRALKFSRIMQVYRDMAVGQKLLCDEASSAYLQRSHHRTAKTGYATVGHAAAAGKQKLASSSIHAKIKACRECE